MGINKTFERGLDCPIRDDFFPLQEVIQISKKNANLFVQGSESMVDVLDIPIESFLIWEPCVVQCVV